VNSLGDFIQVVPGALAGLLRGRRYKVATPSSSTIILLRVRPFSAKREAKREKGMELITKMRQWLRLAERRAEARATLARRSASEPDPVMSIRCRSVHR